MAQAEVPSSTRQVDQQSLLQKDGYQGGWNAPPAAQLELKESEALDEEKIMVDAPMQLNVLRSERNASLARNQGTIPASDQTRIQGLADDLNRKAPASFEAHLANFYAAFPAPAAFQEMELALAKGRDRAELVAPRLLNAVRMDNTAELTIRAKDMKDRGAIAPALYKVAWDMLASTEPGAVLFTAGDMDLFPALVEQFVQGSRKDVLLVDTRLLVDPAYRMRIWERAKAKGQPGSAARFIQDLASATDRPVHLSLALGEKELAQMKDMLYNTGLTMRYSPVPFDNMVLLEGRWSTFKKSMDAGPLSRNYLVPGSALLLHYRAIGDEPRAARLEFELREMAKRLGATNALFKAGILAH